MNNVEVIYQGRGNTAQFVLKENDVPADISTFTRVLLKVKYATATQYVDSTVNANAIDWSAGGGLLTLDLGDVGLPNGRGHVQIISFDATNPPQPDAVDPANLALLKGGLVWGEIPFSFRD